MWLSSALSSVYNRLTTYGESLCRFGKWSCVLVMVAAVAAFCPELAFLRSSRGCGLHGYVKLPLDLPGKSLCLPSHMIKGSAFDAVIPLMFAPVAVICSGLVLSSFGL